MKDFKQKQDKSIICKVYFKDYIFEAILVVPFNSYVESFNSHKGLTYLRQRQHGQSKHVRIH